jgi:hypothetical protein
VAKIESPNEAHVALCCVRRVWEKGAPRAGARAPWSNQPAPLSAPAEGGVAGTLQHLRPKQARAQLRARKRAKEPCGHASARAFARARAPRRTRAGLRPRTPPLPPHAQTVAWRGARARAQLTRCARRLRCACREASLRARAPPFATFTPRLSSPPHSPFLSPSRALVAARVLSRFDGPARTSARARGRARARTFARALARARAWPTAP